MTWRRVLACWVIVAAVSAGTVARAVAEPPPPPPAPTLEVFTRPGCSHCARAATYVDELRVRRPEVRVIFHDIIADLAARERLRGLATRQGAPLGVPAFLIDDRLIVGFDGPASTGAAIEAALDDRGAALDTVDLPFVGAVRVRELGLPTFAVVLGLVDGFNPCAMWVLVFLLSLLVNLESRRRMAVIGGSFVAVSAIAYYVFMTAWLSMFLVVGAARWLEVGLGVIAIAAGSIHVKDFVTPHHGPSLSIPARAKPRIYARVRRIVYADNLRGAIAATIGLAVMVNLVELLCTAGLPALFTQILSAHGLSWWEHHAYMLLYVAAYMLDDAAILAIGIITLSRHKLQERAGRVLKLVSGAVMIALGLVLIARPDWLRFG